MPQSVSGVRRFNDFEGRCDTGTGSAAWTIGGKRGSRRKFCMQRLDARRALSRAHTFGECRRGGSWHAGRPTRERLK